ncbi:hypothetical protein BDP55DRAFT_730454 [Colletotrichum godetiae]|uniref:EC87 protein n=1 Tax=Colletotrichum godetiae TaxID=1209918 RepID=A0AAJ0ER85_9PEZI|nr:uncharacterized protein BDP55DRAFT_730454 [Colletotrichum godetiae]KAK1673656.1 hypothetical protein BDP55DRAFT_730454 [Colletotrichum godetiae]
MRAVFAIVSLLAATVAARFDGPCTDTVCGESNVNCEAEGRICVGFPSVDPEKRIGCTCSIGRISHPGGARLAIDVDMADSGPN